MILNDASNLAVGVASVIVFKSAFAARSLLQVLVGGGIVRASVLTGADVEGPATGCALSGPAWGDIQPKAEPFEIGGGGFTCLAASRIV